MTTVDDAPRPAKSLLEEVGAYAATDLRPRALETDRLGVADRTVRDLGALGALNHLAPTAYGGADLDRADDRRLHEIIAGACFNTWLVWAQHGPQVGRIRQAVEDAERTLDPLESDLVDRILRGRVFLGAALSDVRRYPDRYVAARRTSDGWIFDGTISWVSGWGLNEWLGVAGVDDSDAAGPRVVYGLIPVGAGTLAGVGGVVGAGVDAEPLRLSAATGSRTERVTLRGIVVPERHVIAVQDLDSWRAADVAAAADARPHHFGLAATVLDELRASSHPSARRVADAWAPRVARIREQAYAITDEVTTAGPGAPQRVDERLALKVAAGEALATLTRALLVARAGHGLTDDDTAQLHARSALFVLVQGQTAAVREAQLNALAD
ncbi:alkylation response protein AidB-like acyl-CoA dehydrogenase [Kribbella aluminosa]|uniref:Alkylation response protein AidB-like acyl-CoA dehydrogenase n=1 Tax=Kribbella aluminosa TaxID=416017 RepID=A0ABS4UJS9_9ACTN|nr:acyl-CoA dehydrogenase family protein [Kribbella aluminosa]MBP2351869.1 alkylation response protein AidB-like acyl-CoA dehydrogenase [Kribbella aluminosa]